MSVRFRAAAEIMAAHDAGKAASLAGANHIHVLGVLENIDQYLVAGLQFLLLAVSGPVLARRATSRISLTGGTLVLAKWPAIGLFTLRALHKLDQADLRRA